MLFFLSWQFKNNKNAIEKAKEKLVFMAKMSLLICFSKFRYGDTTS